MKCLFNQDSNETVIKRCQFMFVVSVLVFGTSLACKTSIDPSNNGMSVDCSVTGLTPDRLKHLEFPGVSTLILSNNYIPTLKNNSFIQHRHLKNLVCENCHLRNLEIDALTGLDELEFLSLANNRLKIIDQAFPRGFFRHAPHLNRLYIGGNGNNGYASNYSNFIDIFDSLQKLEVLTIDSFRSLRIGKEFLRLKFLKRLQIVCTNIHKMSDNSFKGFQTSGLKHLSLINGRIHSSGLDVMAFQYLPNITSLSIDYFKFGSTNLLKMLKPLEGRQMEEIYFKITNSNTRILQVEVQNRVFTNENTRHLTNICVSHFKWIGVDVFAIESGAFTSEVWMSCLKSFTFISNGFKTTFMVDMVILWRFFHFKQLERIFVMQEHHAGIEQNFWEENGGFNISEDKNDFDEYSKPVFYKATRDKREAMLIRNTSSLQDLKSFKDGCADSTKAFETRDFQFTDSSNLHLQTVVADSLLHNEINEHKKSLIHGISKKSILVKLTIPPRVKIIVLDDIGTVSLTTDLKIKENVLETLYCRNNHGYGLQFRNRVLGLNHLKTIDFSNSRMDVMNPSFYKWFPSLTKLVLNHTQRESEFYSKTAANIQNLEYYDISSNGLVWLPEMMFYSNQNLKYLNLASNRFPALPFDMRLTPSLKILDLRANALVDLSLKHRRIIDDHIGHVHEMTILLDRNPISCTCSALPFLKWLFQTSKVHFDKDANYTCFSEDGKLSFTSHYSDIKSFWRKCQGRYYFLISLILAFTLMTLYLIVYLSTTHKTQIISKVMQLVVHDFRLQKRQDFAFDVCLGYADQDGEYVRNTLLRYLETSWKLRTFVHQRDMLHDPLMMSQAIRESWRNVLLITKNFLDRHSMAHNIMKVATFFVSPSNPRSVIVMVEESVRHRVPDYVLQVVDEDNIIVLRGLDLFLDYEAKETLKTRILC